MRTFLLFPAVFLILLSAGLAAPAQVNTYLPETLNDKNKIEDAALTAKAAGWLRDAEAGFAENKGQVRDQHGRANVAVKYLLNLPGLTVQLRAGGFSYDAWVEEKQTRKFHRVDVQLEGANRHTRMVTSEPLAGLTNVIKDYGSFEGIRRYRTITYIDIYPGIDLEFVARKGTDKPVEYNFIVHPGADASRIKMRYANGSDIALKNGEIEMKLAFGLLKEKIPASYTQQDGRAVTVRYKVANELQDVYAFHIPAYDRRQTLVIDPTPSLVWATYYGGNGSFESMGSIDTDAAGNIYVDGYTNSTDNFASAGAFQATFKGGSDIFIARFTSAGIRQWGTFWGGTSNESPGEIKVSGNAVYITGVSYSTTGAMATAGAWQTAFKGNSEGVLGKFNTSDGSIVWATYYGDTGAEDFYRLFIGADGSVYAAGTTYSSSGIASAGTMQTTLSGAADVMVVKFNASGGRQWATYLGGPDNELVSGLAADASGNVYVSGKTSSASGIATAGAFQPTFGGWDDIFLVKINSTGTAKVWGTYWGFDDQDWGIALKMDRAGNLVVGGKAWTTGFASPGSWQTQHGGSMDVVIGKFSPNGNFLWGTYYGGTQREDLIDIDLDENDNILLVGEGAALSSGLATNCTYQPDTLGRQEIFIAKLSADGTGRVWGTYFGTSGVDAGSAIKSLGNGNFMIGGSTLGTTGLATAGAWQAVKGTGQDGFLAKFSEGQAPPDVKLTTSSIAPLSQTACVLGIPNMITGNAVSLYNPPTFTSPVFYQWQVADAATGPWTDVPGEVFKDLQPQPASGVKYYRRLVLVSNGFCDKKAVDSSAAAEVLISADVAPIAQADGPRWYVCGAGANTITLNGSATGGSGGYSFQWFAGSNFTTPVSTSATYTPTITTGTTYTLRVNDNLGCVDIDQVTVMPAIANAGRDTTLCANSGGVQIGTPGVPGGSVTYSWSSVSGSPVATLSCTNCAQPVANPAVATTYRLTTTVTLKDGTTCSTTDEVLVTFVAAPTGGASFGGTDKTTCKNTPVVLGGVNDPAATYQWSPGSYLTATNTVNPGFDAGTNTIQCPMVYTVTATKNGCTFTDQVNVNVIDPATSLDGQRVSCESWASGNTNNCAGATYNWQLVSGPGIVPTGDRLRNDGADAYLVNTGTTDAVYQRTTTLYGITCTSDNIIIEPCGTGSACPPIKPITPHGCPKVFGTQELQLYVDGIKADDYNFSWTPANIMDNPLAPVVNIVTTSPVTVHVTITNKITGRVCTASLDINNPAWALPVVNLPDKGTCPGIPVPIGEPDAAGYAYEWWPAIGLSAATIGNPVATLSASRDYIITKTDMGSGCVVRDTVLVTVRSIDFDAGNNRTICNGGTVTLGTTPGDNYIYNWSAANAVWTNGSGPGDANPQVLFASSEQVFYVTITDPLSGCEKKDTVILRGTQEPGEYAGPGPAPVCPGETIQLGRAPELDATYQWSPATGLSCTTCSNPVVTAGNTTQTYTVQISYPGCNVPISDNVEVTVKSVPDVVLTDKTICPSTPTNIGIGGAGNTASLADVAGYEWSPASGLSCTNCASPNANPVAVTTYTVTINFTNGCTLQKQVTVTPTVIATAKPDATICPGGTVVLGGPAGPNVTYSWTVVSGSAGSITPTNVAQPTANPAATTVYRLTATGTGPAAGCTVADDVMVTVKPLRAFNITGNASVCTGGTVTLSADPIAANTTYQWSPATGVAAPNSPITTIMPAATTTYRVTQTDMNSGCSDYKEVVVSVSPNNVVVTGDNITVCPASSATMPLTVSPATGNTIVWSPATYLSSPFAQNPTISPQAGGATILEYIAKVTNNATSCSDTALVRVTVPASCLIYDFGDVPQVYEKGDPAGHAISPLLKIGTATDAEGAPASAAAGAPATGDDNYNTINDEEGVSFLPVLTTTSTSLGLIVNNVLNNIGKTAYLAAWIDFNRDGDFDDVGERSQIASLGSNGTAANVIVQFGGFNAGCVVKAGISYVRVRLTTDITNGWDIDPAATGIRTDGEVEDYSIVIAGTDFGDAPAIYPVAKAQVNPDLDEDGQPDAAGSVWLGNVVDYNYSCRYLASSSAKADDNDFTDNDEDGLNTHGNMTPGTTKTWHLTVNSQGAVSGVQWGMWIDWNADGVMDAFYNGSVNTASPVVVPISVTSPADMTVGYMVRTGVRSGPAFTASDFSTPIINGEWEDYVAPGTTLSVSLISFTATKVNNTALLKWATSEESNSDHFVVERSTDGLNWKQTGRVKASGNSAVVQHYSFTDHTPLHSLNYYRLRMVDKDGRYTISSTRLLNFSNEGNPVTIVPNPAHGAARLVFAKAPRGNITVQIRNHLGQMVQNYTINSAGVTYTMNLPVISKGIYYVTVKGQELDAQVKLLVE